MTPAELSVMTLVTQEVREIEIAAIRFAVFAACRSVEAARLHKDVLRVWEGRVFNRCFSAILIFFKVGTSCRKNDITQRHAY